MYFVYILKSLKSGKYYIGSTENLEVRIHQHNTGFSRWTKTHAPFELVYSELYNTRSESLRREKQVKKFKSGKAFKKLVEID